MITAEHRTKRQKNGNVHEYVYYRCTKKLGPCRQPHVRDGALEDQIREKLRRITLPPRLTDWVFSMVKREHEELEELRREAVKNHTELYERANRKLMNLVDMRAAGLVEEEVFTQKRTEYLAERHAAEERMRDAGEGVTDWVENARRLFNFAEQAGEGFDLARRSGDTTKLKTGSNRKPGLRIAAFWKILR
jgi:site-specific DNA recombinase